MTDAVTEHRRVLIIDDDAMVGKVLQSHALALGHEAQLTDDPTVFFARQLEWQPDVLIVDLAMAKMDGLDVLSQLARNHCTAAVIISSGMGARVMDAARRFADANGLEIAGLLPKPFKRAQLAELLDARPDEVAPGAALPHRALAPWTPVDFDRDFRAALDQGQIRVALQPKVACTAGMSDVVGFEALARWAHPTRGNVPPGAFVPMAEAGGLASALSDYVLAQALAWFRTQDGELSRHLAVNISATELIEPAIDQRILRACTEAGVEPSRVVLEVTETTAMDDPVKSLELLTRLRLEGFRVSIDDFGTGFSSMAQLARLPFTEIKVDQSFVMQATHNYEAKVVVRSVIDLGHALGLECVAEGVETAEAFELLTELGCDVAQGYFIGRPMYPEQIAVWLDRREREQRATG